MYIYCLGLGAIPKISHDVHANIPPSPPKKSKTALVPSISDKEYSTCICMEKSCSINDHVHHTVPQNHTHIASHIHMKYMVITEAHVNSVVGRKDT